jgi:outer membrane protein OmpA-like peptidoglycan-associated protein
MFTVLAACSSVPDSVNPVRWYQGAEEAILGKDEPAAADSGAAPGGQPPREPYALPAEVPGSGEPFPNLADVPARPRTSTAAERAQLTEGLVADHAQRQYSGEVIPLQGSVDEPAVRTVSPATVSPSFSPSPPPPVAAAPPPVVAAPPPPPPGSPAAASREATAAAPERHGGAAVAFLAAVDAETEEAAPPPPPSAVPAPVAAEPPAVPIPEPTAVAEVPPMAPSPPPPPPAPPVAAMPPPLPPAPPPSPAATPIEDARARIAALPTVDVLPPPGTRSQRSQQPLQTVVVTSRGVDLGRSGNLPPPRAAAPAERRAANPTASHGVAPESRQATQESASAARSSMPARGAEGEGTAGYYKVATILFANSSAELGARERQILGQVAVLHGERGGRIRIVGHASGQTRAAGADDRDAMNREVSLSRAGAVANELVRQGVPREAIAIGAAAADQPRYEELFPAGEAGNRRAEVYFER